MINEKAINTLRVTACDMINKAKSGHPGIALGTTPILYALFNQNLKANPNDNKWINRDYFILSAGHGSSILYTLYHLLGYKISIEDLKNFRQLNSLTPGHPELGHTDGVEATTGPLGQGIAMSVGAAISYKHLSAKYNQKDLKIFDNKIYCLCGDGDLQEGISYEAISLAGHLQLNNLILLYDSNNIQLDGATDQSFSEDIKKRFESANWSYLKVENGTSHEDIKKAISIAKENKKPTIIEIKTIIGYGSTFQNSSKVHGSPLMDDINNLRNNLNYHNDPFEIDQEVYDHFKEIFLNYSLSEYEKYQNNLNEYKIKYPKLYEKLENNINGNINFNIKEYLKLFEDKKDLASRNSSGIILNKLTSDNEIFFGGSADLSASTKVSCNAEIFSKKNYDGRNFYFGVREHAMGAIANGIALTGMLRPIVSGFFVFSDYVKPAIRLSALMKLPVLYIFTHDSVYVGEDGPTHQPIEQLTGLRAIPDLNLFRPADTKEVISSYNEIVKEKNKPSILVLSRQNLTDLENSNLSLKSFKGAYIVSKENIEKELDFTIIASGSEVKTAIDAKNILKKYNIRVISIPSFEIFKNQNKKFIDSLINPSKKVFGIEASSAESFFEYADKVYRINRFGLSAPDKKVIEALKFTAKDFASFIKKELK